MNKFNKITAVILILSTGICSAYAAVDDVPVPRRFLTDEASSDNSQYKGIYSLLSYLKLIDEPIEDLKMSKNVTRAYAAKTLAKMVSPELGEISEKPYNDVDTANVYASAIACAKNYGILEDSENFYPDRNVTYRELSEWLSHIIRYDLLNQDAYTYAAEHDFFKGLSYAPEKQMTYEEFFVCLENALNAETVGVTFNADGMMISESENESYLSQHDIVLQKGIVTGAYYMNLNPNIVMGKDEIEINKRRFKMNGTADLSLFEKAVFAYADCGGNEDKVICAWENSKENTVWEIAKSDFESFKDGKISAYDEKKHYYVKTDSETFVFYNGIYYDRADNIGEDMLKKSENFEVVDNDRDNIADAVFLHEYQDFAIDGISELSKIIAFMYNNDPIKTENGNVTLSMNGKACELSTLQKYNIATIEKITPKNEDAIYNISVSQDGVNGKVSAKASDEDGSFYEIDGEKYYLSKSFEDAIEKGTVKEVPEIGKSGDFYLSVNGKVAAVKMLDEAEYGYLRSVFYDEETDKYFVKMYTDNGKFERFELDSKLKFYSPKKLKGERLSDKAVYEELLSDSGAVNESIVTFKQKDGKISELAQPLDRVGKTPGTIDYPLTKDYVCTNGGEDARLYMKLLGAKYYVGSTKTFEMPSVEGFKDDEKAYKVKTNLGTSSDYYFKNEKVTLYNADKFYVPDFAVIEKQGIDTSTLAAEKRSYMIQKSEIGLDADDEPVMNIYVYEGGSLVKKTFSTEAVKVEPESGEGWYGTKDAKIESLTKGDIIQFETNATGEIESVKILVKFKNIGNYRIQSGTSSTVEPISKNSAKDMASISIVYGKLKDRKDSILLVNTSDSGNDETYQEAHYISNVYGQNTYTLLDSKTMEVTNSQSSELMPGDTVILKKEYSQVCDIYIIR